MVLVVPADWQEPTTLLADDLAAGKVAAAVAGGATRADSVAAGLAELPPVAELVLVHDAARPLADAALIDRVLAGMAGCRRLHPGAAGDRHGEAGRVRDRSSETLDRSRAGGRSDAAAVPTASAPAAYEQAAGDLCAATDCSSLVEAAGVRVVTVSGDPRNLKITDRERPGPAEGAGPVLVDYHMHLVGRRRPYTDESFTVRTTCSGTSNGRPTAVWRDRVHRPRLPLHRRPRLARQPLWQNDGVDDLGRIRPPSRRPTRRRAAGQGRARGGLPAARRGERLRAWSTAVRWDYVLGSVHWSAAARSTGRQVDLGSDDGRGGLARTPTSCAPRRERPLRLDGAPRRGQGVRLAPDPPPAARCTSRSPTRFQAAGVCAEVSTAGLQTPLARSTRLRRCCGCSRRGVPVTLASDAH